MALSNDTAGTAVQETADGTKVGRNADSKVGFYGTTPIVKPTVPTAATGTQLAAALASLGLLNLS